MEFGSFPGALRAVGNFAAEVAQLPSRLRPLPALVCLWLFLVVPVSDSCGQLRLIAGAMSAFSSVPDNRSRHSGPALNTLAPLPPAARKRGLSTPGSDDPENIDPVRRLAHAVNEDVVSPADAAVVEVPSAVSPQSQRETQEEQDVSAASSSPEGESEAERLAREAAESEALAWRLVREEQERAYRLQMECMRAMAAGLSEEDRRALESAIAEGVAPAAEDDEEEDFDVDAMDYEQLLELGQAMGDVRKEVPYSNPAMRLETRFTSH